MITSVQSRPRWSAAEKVQLVEDTSSTPHCAQVARPLSSLRLENRSSAPHLVANKLPAPGSP